jgi:glucose dehydrogenase
MTMRMRVLPSVSAVLLSAAAISTIYGQKAKDNTPKVDPGDWPAYTRDLAGTRYSPLKQITTSNVSTLTQAWTYKLRAAAAPAAAAPG